MKRIALITSLLALTACEPPRPMSFAEQQARNECEMEALRVNGYDWVDAVIKQGQMRRLCLQSKGYQ
jgi:hypothetical protein